MYGTNHQKYNDFYRESHRRMDEFRPKNNDINTLQIDIQNRINFAIMQIDQMNVTQEIQSALGAGTGPLDKSRFDMISQMGQSNLVIP